MVYSATAPAFAGPVVVTTMPRAVAAARSTPSLPAPWRAMMRKRGAASITPAVTMPSRARIAVAEQLALANVSSEG
jgi:hypothetical protein